MKFGSTMEVENKDMTTVLPEAHLGTESEATALNQELLVEETLELDQQKAALSAEEYQKFLVQLEQAGKKIIATKPLVAEELFLVQDLLNCLTQLQAEVLVKRDAALQHSTLIKDKVQALIASGKVRINQDEYVQSEESVNQYAGLLDNIVNEVENEMNFFRRFTANAMPTQVVAWLHEPDDFNEFIKAKVKFVKKYVKSIKKDLNVSFSRYNFGFQSQISRITYVEKYVSQIVDRASEMAEATHK
jgi:hypothetical protein